MNPYHDKRGRFTNAANASTRTGENAPTYGRGKPNARNRIQRWSKDELAEPRRVPKAVQQEQAKIEDLKKQVGAFALDSTKPVPQGKYTRLYHYTSPERAASIMREGFNVNRGRNTPYASNPNDKNYMYGVLPTVKDKWSGYGKSLVSVRVRTRDTQVDKSMGTYYPAPRRVPLNKLNGRKFTQHK